MPKCEDCDALEDYRLNCVNMFESGDTSDSFVRRIDISYQTICKVCGIYGKKKFASDLRKLINARKVILHKCHNNCIEL